MLALNIFRSLKFVFYKTGKNQMYRLGIAAY